MYDKSFGSEIKISNKNFQKILNFYLFNCPTPGKSIRSKTFAMLGWNGKTQFAQLKRKMLTEATKSLKHNYYPSNKADLHINFKKISNVAPVDEYCVFLKTDEKSVIQSLFSAIRNAFAHGSFSVQTYKKVRVYFFANYHNYLKAEIVLQEKTLLAWIEILEKGYVPQ